MARYDLKALGILVEASVCKSLFVELLVSIIQVNTNAKHHVPDHTGNKNCAHVEQWLEWCITPGATFVAQLTPS